MVVDSSRNTLKGHCINKYNFHACFEYKLFIVVSMPSIPQAHEVSFSHLCSTFGTWTFGIPKSNLSAFTFWTDLAFSCRFMIVATYTFTQLLSKSVCKNLKDIMATLAIVCSAKPIHAPVFSNTGVQGMVAFGTTEFVFTAQLLFPSIRTIVYNLSASLIHHQ